MPETRGWIRDKFYAVFGTKPWFARNAEIPEIKCDKCEIQKLFMQELKKRWKDEEEIVTGPLPQKGMTPALLNTEEEYKKMILEGVP